MPNIDFVMSMFMPWDVPHEVADQVQMEVMLLYTRKPIVFVSVDLERCIDLVAMAAELAGGLDELRLRPQAACYNNVTAPLRHNAESVQKLLYLAGLGLPQLYVPGTLRGVTGPMTIAGSLVLSNACQLTGLVLSQLKREGAPFIRGFGGSTLDMRTMVNLYAEPERSRANSDLAHYYDLPVFGIAGCADSKQLDEQAAIEAALTLLMDALSGTNLIHDVGYLESGLLGSLEAVVLCDEVIGWVMRHMAAVEVNPETLAVDLIDQVGPDGSFLEQDHTLRHFREDWYPRYMDRKSHADWVARGQPTMRARIREAVAAILSTPAEPVVPAEVAGRVRAIRQRAEARLGPTPA
jgi:trimethylamine--corrinoid protein Co-methyltransferase